MARCGVVVPLHSDVDGLAVIAGVASPDLFFEQVVTCQVLLDVLGKELGIEICLAVVTAGKIGD